MAFDAYQPPNGKWADWDADAPVQPLTMSAQREAEIEGIEQDFAESDLPEGRAIRDLKRELDETRKRLGRLFDLVRHQRGELHEAELITDEEYVALAAAQGSVRRLETYDGLRKRLAEAGLAFVSAKAQKEQR